VRILADVHIAPRTVEFLRSLGHDTLRVPDVLPSSASDEKIVAYASADRRCVLTQDLDFSAIVALTGVPAPSVISLRLASSRVEYVNAVLAGVLPELEEAVAQGVIASVEEGRVRKRHLPIV
jgi:predicted nuclease of predicted toxin-antitoxin system